MPVCIHTYIYTLTNIIKEKTGINLKVGRHEKSQRKGIWEGLEGRKGEGK